MATSKKILLVDDNPLVLEMMGRALNKEGFYCMKAISADAATEILKQERPDIILSDYHMPDVDGFAFRQNLIGYPSIKISPLCSLHQRKIMM
jgi:sigma-B regulation protein RsbU (phosphoserine phosphatase)